MKRIAPRILGGLALLLMVVSLVRDIVDPEAGGGSDAAQAGFQMGAILGTAVRTAILYAVGIAFLKALKSSPRRVRQASSPPTSTGSTQRSSA